MRADTICTSCGIIASCFGRDRPWWTLHRHDGEPPLLTFRSESVFRHNYSLRCACVRVGGSVCVWLCLSVSEARGCISACFKGRTRCLSAWCIRVEWQAKTDNGEQTMVNHGEAEGANAHKFTYDHSFWSYNKGDPHFATQVCGVVPVACRVCVGRD
jgi:hypothetical protein